MVTCGTDPPGGGYSDGPWYMPETRELMVDEMIECAECAMNNLQEAYVEATGALWPRRPRPHAHADVEFDRLVLWYGDSEERYLETPPIDVRPTERPRWRATPG